MASGISEGPEPPRPQQVCEEPHRAEQLHPIQQQSQPVKEQPQEPAVQLQPALVVQPPTPSQVQVQQEEIDRLTNIAAQWSAGNQHRAENTYNNHRHRYTHDWSTTNMSPVVPDYNNHRYYDNHGWQGSNFDRQVPEQRRFSNAVYSNTIVSNPNFLHVLDSYSSKQAK